jgi:CHAT domain-containing protein/Flp pilus assembly protein TadD
MNTDSAGQNSVVTILPYSFRFSILSSMPDRALSAVLLSVFVLGCVASPPAAPPTKVVPVAMVAAPLLQPGIPMQRNLKDGGGDEVSLTLAKDRYARILFETSGQDLLVSLLGLQGQVVFRSAGSDGRLTLITDAAGTYRVLVSESSPSKVPLSYRIVLQEPRPVQQGDAQRISAESELGEAKLLETKGKYPEAIEKAQAALDLFGTIQDADGRFEALYELGVLHDRANQQSKEPALGWYRQALQVAEEAGNSRGTAKAHTAIGLALFSLREEEACAHLRVALPVLRESGDSAALAEVLFRLGIHAYNQGRLDEAKALYRQTLDLVDPDQNSALNLDALNALGTLYLARGENKEAADLYRDTLDRSAEEGNPRVEALALTGLGVYDRRRGDPQNALAKFLKARDITAKNRLAADEGRVLLHLGAVYMDLGETAKAMSEYREAIQAFQKAEDNRWIANSLLSLGNAHLREHRASEALEQYQRALKIVDAKADRTRGTALHAIAMAQLELGRTQDAVASLDKALKLLKITDKLGTALTYQDLGKVCQAQGDLAQAEVSLRVALDLAVKVEASLPQASIRFDLARLKRRQGDLRESLAQIKSAVDILEQVRSNVIEDQLRTSFFASRRTYYDFYVDLLMELEHREPGQGFAREALSASERGRARSFLDLLTAGRLQLTRGISSDLRRQETEVQARLSQIQESLVNERSQKERAPYLEALEENRKKAEEDRQEVERRIHDESPVYYQVRYPTLLRQEDVQNLLDTDSALLEYYLGDEKSYLFVVTKQGGLRVHSLKLSKEEIAAQVAVISKTFQSPDDLSYGYRRAANSLYRALVAPAEADLAGKRLLIAPDGALNYLPFETLLTGLGEEPVSRLPYLLKKYSMSYVQSASVLHLLSLQQAKVGPRKRFLAFAPSYESSPTPQQASVAVRGGAFQGSPLALKGVSEEVNAIASKFSPDLVKLYLGPDASRENAIGTPLASDSIHFASHGLLDEEHPEKSGLVLARGEVLQVSDIFNLDLSADMVVLSACDTAGKEVTGEGLMGLTRAFLYAGSPSVVVTLWKVSDSKSPELMLRFYENLERSGDRAESLRQAKIGMVRSGGLFAHPYYWAPFILVGKPR